jgi:Rha family phage regulatory protein
MGDLVFKSEKGTPVTNSLLVAQKFGKRHDSVLRDIDNLSCSEKFRILNFVETPYVHPQNGQTYRMYVMTKDGFSFLVMGYTGKEAGQFKEDFINAFNKMDNIIKTSLASALPNFNNPAEAARAWAQEYEQKQLAEQRAYVLEEEKVFLKQEVEELLPDADYTKQTLKSTSTLTTTQIAKELGMSAEKLNSKLHDLGVQYKIGKQWVLYAKYQNRGYAKTNTYTETINGESKTWHLTVWTERGRAFVHQLMKGGCVMRNVQNPQTGIDRADLFEMVARAQLHTANAKHREVMAESKYTDLAIEHSNLAIAHIELQGKYEELCDEMYGDECKKAVRNSVLLPSGTRVIEFNPAYKAS